MTTRVPPARRGGRGGRPIGPDFQESQLRADLAAIATRHCYQHGARIVDEILGRFEVIRKPIKEQNL